MLSKQFLWMLNKYFISYYVDILNGIFYGNIYYNIAELAIFLII